MTASLESSAPCTDAPLVLKTTVDKKVKRVCEGHAPERELTARPDLLRLTRRALLVAELLPWPVKSGLFQAQPQLALRRDGLDTKFSGGDGLETAHCRGNPLWKPPRIPGWAATAVTPNGCSQLTNV